MSHHITFREICTRKWPQFSFFSVTGMTRGSTEHYAGSLFNNRSESLIGLPVLTTAEWNWVWTVFHFGPGSSLNFIFFTTFTVTNPFIYSPSFSSPSLIFKASATALEIQSGLIFFFLRALKTFFLNQFLTSDMILQENTFFSKVWTVWTEQNQSGDSWWVVAVAVTQIWSNHNHIEQLIRLSEFLSVKLFINNKVRCDCCLFSHEYFRL